MALSRFVVGTTCTVPAGTVTAGSFGTASYAGATGPPLQWSGGGPAVFQANQVIWADSSAGSTGPQQLYAALQAAGANLRAFVDGQDTVGHAGLAN